MANWKKLAQGAAGAAGGGLDTTEVFSTYTFATNNQRIYNNIDLANEGGMVWLKGRHTVNHLIYDTNRGTTSSFLSSSTTSAENGSTFGISSFNSDGFTTSGFGGVDKYVSWTFRKAPKFFDVVTYTGNAQNNRQISHNLGQTPGLILVKNRDAGSDWAACLVAGPNGSGSISFLNKQDADSNASGSGSWFDGTCNDSVFTINNTSDINANGYDFVAYVFANNNSDGGFGPNGDDIIKCGYYTGDGANEGQIIDIGFQAGFVITKRTSAIGDWFMWDEQRGMAYQGGDAKELTAQSSAAENSTTKIEPHPKGFRVKQGNTNGSGDVNFYLAIRRGTLNPPEDAANVFDIDTATYTSTPMVPMFDANFTPDMGIVRYGRSSATVNAVLFRDMGDAYLRTQGTNTLTALGGDEFEFMDGMSQPGNTTTDWIAWMWKRAPGYFDTALYLGNGQTSHQVTHNLGAVPEMMWIKCISSAQEWRVYHKDLGNTKSLQLNDSTTPQTNSVYWNNTTPTDSVFTVGSQASVNSNNQTFVGFLFGSISGVSKVGSYTGNGSNQNIDCGFSNGARYVLIKDVSASDNWYFFDTLRGINAGTDPFLRMDSTASEENTDDVVDYYSGGFNVLGFINTSGRTYIFYAIA